MLERRIFVAAAARLGEGVVQRLFELTGKGRHSILLRARRRDRGPLDHQYRAFATADSRPERAANSPHLLNSSSALARKLTEASSLALTRAISAFEHRDPRLQLLDRQRVEILLGQQLERIVGLVREELVEVHAGKVDRSLRQVNKNAANDGERADLPAEMNAIDPAEPGGPKCCGSSGGRCRGRATARC